MIDAIAVIAVGMFAVACDLAVVIAVLPAFSMAAASATDAEAVGVIGGIRIRLGLAAQRSILQAVALRGDHLLDAVREGTAQAINVMLFIDERLGVAPCRRSLRKDGSVRPTTHLCISPQ